MEYLAFKHCINYVNESGLTFDTFISDRHTSIAKHMKEQLRNVMHYFDLWHLRKSMLEYIQHCCVYELIVIEQVKKIFLTFS